MQINNYLVVKLAPRLKWKCFFLSREKSEEEDITLTLGCQGGLKGE